MIGEKNGILEHIKLCIKRISTLDLVMTGDILEVMNLGEQDYTLLVKSCVGVGMSGYKVVQK